MKYHDSAKTYLLSISLSANASRTLSGERTKSFADDLSTKAVRAPLVIPTRSFLSITSLAMKDAPIAHPSDSVVIEISTGPKLSLSVQKKHGEFSN